MSPKTERPSRRKNTMKTYTIIKTHNEKTYETTGTITELVEYFSYTLKSGASYNGQKGCKKVNTEPKTIKSLITALQNAVYNTQGSCYNQDSYDYTEVVSEKTTKAAKKSTKTTKTTTTITVVLKAFTGMVIGTYATEMTETGCKITTKNGKVLEFGTQNPVLGLVLCMVLLYLFERFKEKKLICVVMALAGLVWAGMLKVDHGVPMILMVCVVRVFRNKHMFMGFSGMAAAALCTGISPFYLAAPMGFLAVHFYNGEKGEGSRVVNYLFYPVTLLIIGLVGKFAF